jgi:hypothetical protein
MTGAVESIAEIERGGELGGVRAHPLMAQVEILSTTESGTLVNCKVPTYLIDHEEVPVKEEWARDLAKQMRDTAETEEDTGQLAPIILGAIDGVDTFKIIDGFHRDAAMEINGEEYRSANIKLTDWNKLYDVRIFTAKDHAHVRFSRVVQWIREVWEYSGLSDKLSVEQAVLLYEFNTSGARLDLAPEDVEAAKAWVKIKEDAWKMDAMTIRGHLKVAEHVDPRLVHSTREKKSSHVLEAPTQAILKVFAEYLPDNFELQNLVMDAAKAHNFRGPHVRALCLAVRDFTDLLSAQSYIEQIDWEKWQPEYEESKKRALRRAHDPRFKGAAVFDQAVDDVARVAERVQLSLERREEVTSEMQHQLREAHERLNEIMVQLKSLGGKLVDLAAKGASNDFRGTDAGMPNSHPLDTATKEPAIPTNNQQAKPPTFRPPSPEIQTEMTGNGQFSESLLSYLNGTSEDLPIITTKGEITRAERVLRGGGFAGHPKLIEDVHEEIRQARRNLPS